MPKSKVFVTTDASDTRSGAVLSFGETWESARPVAFDSMTFKGAELNYPVHEKEMLAIIRVLKHWRSDLIGASFLIHTDHKTLENFGQQKELSRRQAQWMEFLSQYDGRIVYVKGENNTVADALSRLPDLITTSQTSPEAEVAASPIFHITSIGNPVALVLKIPTRDQIMVAMILASIPDATSSKTTVEADERLLSQIKEGYKNDPFILSLQQASPGMSTVRNCNGFWFIREQLIVPNIPCLWEALFHTAHNVLGHFGTDKTYATL